MFGNVGNKIMNCAIVIMCIGFTAAVISGLYIIFSATTGAGIGIGLLTGVGGCLMTWISGLVLYGFGKLVDNTEQLNKLYIIQRALDKLNDNVSRLVQMRQEEQQDYERKNPVEPLQNKTVIETERKEPAFFSLARKEGNAFFFPTRKEEEIYCPNCGEKQLGNRNACWECGVRFAYEDEKK